MLEHIKTDSQVALLFEDIIDNLEVCNQPHSFVGLFEKHNFIEKCNTTIGFEINFIKILGLKVKRYIRQEIKKATSDKYTPDYVIRYQIAKNDTATSDSIIEAGIKDLYENPEEMNLKIQMTIESLASLVSKNSLMNDNCILIYTCWSDLLEDVEVFVVPLRKAADSLLISNKL